jgi:N-acetylglucosaminyl-diphospho-decaprenol L-rhamnosyltransferase
LIPIEQPAEHTQAAPRIAVVIVSRNSADALKRLLSALYGRGFFLIAVDCGWGDTTGLDERFAGVRFIRLPRDFGMTKALNLGIRAADTEYVALVAPEVELTAETLEEMAATLDAETSTGSVAPLLPVDQVSDLPSKADPEPKLRPAKPGERVPRALIGAMMFRSFFLRAMRHIDERYGDYGPDIELCQQVLKNGKTILIHPTATAAYVPPPVPKDAAHQADREIGTSRFLAKHHGFWTGSSYLIGRIFAALFSFRLKQVGLLIGQTKIDGN